jgi:hypothetical protein
MLGIPEAEKPRVNENKKIEPLERHGIKVLSMGFLVDPTHAVVWRGPMVSSAVRQFLNDAAWGSWTTSCWTSRRERGHPAHHRADHRAHRRGHRVDAAEGRPGRCA